MEFSDTTPIYQQIADDIRTRIISGVLTAGDQLMSTTEYATTYRINPATAAKAFSQLVAEGVAEKRRGIGVFVTDSAREILTTAGRASFVSEHLAPVIADGLALGFSPDDLRAEVNRLVGETGKE
ncbi:MAG: GntR family transcriptional regulator [Flaviflexus sp.]|nr:GntR family transcriptional regulator [Flaviflexus sp.]